MTDGVGGPLCPASGAEIWNGSGNRFAALRRTVVTLCESVGFNDSKNPTVRKYEPSWHELSREIMRLWGATR